jgi:glycosyltransferase involved in cell wall biosynthesis
MNENNFISVIVPVYNVEDYIEKSLDSLLKQTYKNFEVLIVNDGTQDNSIELAKDIVKDDERFIFLEKENGGLSDARNYGINYAKGNYLTFLDSDDYYDSCFLEKMLSKIIEEKADIVICDLILIKEDYTTIRYQLNSHKSSISGKDALLDISILNMAQNKLYKKELFDDTRYPVGYFYEDRATTYKLFYKSAKISFVNEVLFFYLQRENSITRVLNLQKLSDPLKILKEIKEFLMDKNIYSKYEKKYIQTYLLSVISSCTQIANYSKDYSKDMKNYIKCLDKTYFSLINIFSLKQQKMKKMFALYLLKVSPILFKILAIKEKKL